MAARTPVYFDGTDVVDMTSGQLDQIYRKVRALYAQSPSVTLSYASSGGNMGTLTDTRRISGSTFSLTNTYPTSSALNSYNATSPISVSNAHITETKTAPAITVDSANIKFPLYRDASNDLQAMTATDFIDTFVAPAFQGYLTADTTGDSVGGIYHIQTTSTYAGSTLVNASPIFIDTRHDGLTSGVDQTADQPTNAVSYYLFLKDGQNPDSVDYSVPLHIEDSLGDLQTLDSTSFNSILQNMAKYGAVNTVGARIDYSYTSGTQRGTSITDTRLNSSTTSTQLASSDNYRAQTHPAGTPIVISTYYLGIGVS